MDTSTDVLERRARSIEGDMLSAWNDYLTSEKTDENAFDRFQSKQKELRRVYDGIRETTKFHRFRFTRPSQGLAGWLSRPLGPLPAMAKSIDPTEEATAELPDYRLLGVLLLGVAIALLVGLSYAFPWLSVSPLNIMSRVFTSLLGNVIGWGATVALAIWLTGQLSRGIKPVRFEGGGILDKAAMYEEQWFRMGAESWSPAQRTYSCLSFGAMHIANVWYPVASLLVVTLAGAVFMAVYLKAYRRGGSAVYAVLASAKLHAAYNRFAFAYIGVALLITLIRWIFT